MNLGKQSRKALFLASMALPMASLAWEQFEPEKVPKWSPQAEFLRDSVKKDAEKFLSKVTILGIEISYDDGATWVDYIPHAGGIALATLVIAGGVIVRMRRREEDKVDDFLDTWTDDTSSYLPPLHNIIPTLNEEVTQNVPPTNYLTDLKLYREYKISDSESYEIISRATKDYWNRDNVSLYETLVELTFTLGKKEEFMTHYSRLIELVGPDSEKIKKYEKMALEMKKNSNEA